MSRPINLFSEINHYLQTFTKTDDIKKLTQLIFDELKGFNFYHCVLLNS